MKYLLFGVFVICILSEGCRQRAPQDGMVKNKLNDGSVTEVYYAHGRIIKRIHFTVEGKKHSEMFYFFQSSGMNSVRREEISDKDSIVEYGSKGQIISIMTRWPSADGFGMVITGKRHTDDGKLISVNDSAGFRIYYANGQLQYEKIVIGEKRERQTYFDSTGIKREEWETLNGLRHGKRREYNAQGKITVNEMYDNGNKIRK